jgi:ATP-binding cassette subfamily B protein/subfamily B ATP-binding cassette protein MsbA
VGALVIMLAMNWKLTVVAAVVLPPLWLAIRYYALKIRDASSAIHERESELFGLTQEGLSSIRIVKAFGRESFEIEQFKARATRSLEADLRQNLTSLRSSFVIGGVMALGSAVMYGAGSFEVLRGDLSLGDLLVFVAYLTTLYQPIEQLSYTAWSLESAAAGAQRCFEILDRAEDTEDASDAVAIDATRGEVSFCNVSFAYEGKPPVLQGVDLVVAPGEAVALVGGSGAGKSTLLGLAPRFYDPTQGNVRLDGQDVKKITKAALRAQIGMVLQDTLLFSSTVRENIAYGREGASDAEIIEAAKHAQAYDFIRDLPQGFETLVGERGAFLSMGQRQRIGIARAFLKNAPILLLDEPTSALDAETERAIMQTLQELMKGRTTLIVTHRISVAHEMPRVIVLEHGRILEDGPGASLLAKGGAYARLYHSATVGNHFGVKICV